MSARTSWIVAWYEIDRAYGGPEEGGWWYDCGYLVRAFRALPSREAAYAEARRANGLMQRLQRNHRSVGSVVYDGGRFEARVYQRTAPQHFPERRPVYE